MCIRDRAVAGCAVVAALRARGPVGDGPGSGGVDFARGVPILEAVPDQFPALEGGVFGARRRGLPLIAAGQCDGGAG
eukprot:10130013-Lingulodinium_polyedra.AAC.1